MKLSDFDYEFDRRLIAQRPAKPRDSSRLFYMKQDGSEHLRFYQFPELLQDGDVIVRNVSKVIPARLEAKKETGGKAEILFYRPLDEGWECLIKGSNIKAGSKLYVGDEELEVIKKEGSKYVVSSADPKDLMKSHGKMPTPPYITEELQASDEYQTIYAQEEGSIAAPTAGLHFTDDVLEAISQKNVELHDVILHVGPGTFLPVRTDDVEDHKMGTEYYEIPETTAEAVTAANNEGRRVIVVGTTTVRTLESASKNGVIYPKKGWADLFIYPGYEFQSGMDLLLTNFHLPRSTLLMLVSAFAGKERVMDAYGEAVQMKYRFYSFGDAMLMEGKNAKI